MIGDAAAGIWGADAPASMFWLVSLLHGGRWLVDFLLEEGVMDGADVVTKVYTPVWVGFLDPCQLKT